MLRSDARFRSLVHMSSTASILVMLETFRRVHVSTTKLEDVPVAFAMLVSPEILESRPKEENMCLHRTGVEAGELITMCKSCQEEMTARTFETS
jgi:hypothetical protein